MFQNDIQTLTKARSFSSCDHKRLADQSETCGVSRGAAQYFEAYMLLESDLRENGTYQKESGEDKSDRNGLVYPLLQAVEYPAFLPINREIWSSPYNISCRL
jgi:hypothetical protein